MVADVKVYMDIFQGEPAVRPVEIGAIVAPVLEKPDIKEMQGPVELEVDFRDEAHRLEGDEKWLGYLFHYLIQNGLEAAGKGKGFVRVSSCIEDAPPFNVQIEIFNSGAPPTEDEESCSPLFFDQGDGYGFWPAHSEACGKETPWNRLDTRRGRQGHKGNSRACRTAVRGSQRSPSAPPDRSAGGKSNELSLFLSGMPRLSGSRRALLFESFPVVVRNTVMGHEHVRDSG